MKSLTNHYPSLKNKFYKNLPVFLVGFIDGIIVPLAIYSFIARSAGSKEFPLLVTGISGLVLSVIMGIGAYFTRQAEIRKNGDSKLLKIYASLGISETIQKQMAEDTLQEQQQWQAEWKEGSNATQGLEPINYGFIIWWGYVTGLIVVLLNGFISTAGNLWFLAIPLPALAIAGFAKAKMALQNPVFGLFKSVLTGAVAAIATWLIAGIF